MISVSDCGCCGKILLSTAVALSLALGISANATVLCWIQGIILRPLPGVKDESNRCADQHSWRDEWDRFPCPI